MVKYILKESELRSMINSIVAEELNNVINEGIGSVLKNTAGMAAKTVLSPFASAGDMFSKATDVLTGKDTISNATGHFFNGRDGKTKAQRQSERLAASKNISYEYGKPEVVPSWGNRLKLDTKREIVAPENSQLEWGSFGKHYHDEDDKMWNRMVMSKENAIMRISGQNENKIARLQKKYKKILIGWLKDRDANYEVYIKSNNKI